ncbi:MAG: DUF6048 family protein [Bacteroidota bacterium]
MCRFSFSIILILTAAVAISQPKSDSADFVKIKPDWSPHELKLATNLIRAGRSAFGSGYQSYEVQASLSMFRAIAVLELGIEENERGESFEYLNSGQYLRFGGNWNFVLDQESGNELSLGLRYCRAGFKDDILYTDNIGFGVQEFSYSNERLNARWFEVALNLRGKIVSNLYMGFTMRWQFSRKINGEGVLQAFDVPGFGKTSRQNSTAFDYYLAWRLPLKNKS